MPFWLLSQFGLETFLSIMLIDYNLLKTKLLISLSLTRILCITLTTRISNLPGILNINTRAEQLRLNHVFLISF